jgi:predicted O-methyltransferase YrrM
MSVPARPQLARDGHASDKDFARELARAYLPVSAEVGRLLYLLFRRRSNPLVVEVGSSFGISTIHLAAAVRDLGSGRVVSKELAPGKVQAARANLAEAGLSDLVDLREGDALSTLRGLADAVDVLFLDGWKAVYLPVLELLEPRLRPGAIVVADDVAIFPAVLVPYSSTSGDLRTATSRSSLLWATASLSRFERNPGDSTAASRLVTPPSGASPCRDSRAT